MASPASPTTPLPAPPHEPTTAHAYLLPILSLLSILILIVPFIFHLRARNTGACALIFYLTLFNLMVFINALLWPDNNFSTWWDGAILCDIEVKIMWPITVGVAASTMAITRSLARVLDVENAELNPSRARKRRRVWVDLGICFAVPLLIVGLHHVVHNRRYLIVAIGGCTDSYSGSWPSILIIWIWPLVFTLVNVYYAALVLTRLHRHRSTISTILTTHSLTASRFLRLLLLSLLLLLLYLPLNIYFFYINLSQPLEPYSWSAVHDPAVWAVIPYVPAKGVFTFDRYVPVAMAGFVFVFFGVGEEARRIYARVAVGC
ncbi:a-factor receptor [Pseudogymnoascus verrucosus]|uniref:A-factor receptor n=1 Tax=Pseudogymnoascus verrucosus TaxID=342668 RepID=A0A1B8GUG2_9PEZI|nr:a-factor receptor [Pseudogymnoascus verrucosus]OBT99484.1 a-factor receptor [Pseudogymnoascus verrucosus]